MIKKLLSLFRYKDEKLFDLAHYDSLTGLPNRLSFFNDIEKIIIKTDRQRTNFALLFFDLDNFKRINDTMGHLAGDNVLKTTADRLIAMLRKSDTVYRMGGDEFVMIHENVSNPKGVAQLAEKIIETVSADIEINKSTVGVSASIGICIYPTDAGNLTDVLKQADFAMYMAKDKGGSCYQFYTHEIHEKVVEKLRIENNIRKDLHHEQRGFSILYQPQINIKTGRIVGVEALVRWADTALGEINTETFISICEESNLIVDVDRYVLKQACLGINKINSELGSRLWVSVNFSPRYMHSKEMVKDVLSILEKTGTNPRNLEIEITERTVMEDMESAAHNIQELAKHGIKVSIDDFGIGASSLNYLRKFKVHKLKIDRTFIRDLMNNEDDKKIVNAILALAYHFNLECTAEGVESKDQLEFLKVLNCDSVQGYYFSRPVPWENLIKLVKSAKERRRIKTEEQIQILLKYRDDIVS